MEIILNQLENTSVPSLVLTEKLFENNNLNDV